MQQGTMQGLPCTADKPKEPDWRRGVLRALICFGAGVLLMYEYAVRFPSSRDSTSGLKDDQDKGRDQAAEFTTALHAARQAPVPDFTLADVKAEFGEKYADKAKSLLCSGCKLAASRINVELHARNATGLPDPARLLNATMEAVHVSCEEMPERLTIEPGSRRGSFEFEAHASDGGAPRLSTIELRKAEVAKKSVQRLCEVVLHDAKWDMVEALVRHKVPHLKRRGSGPAIDNWERWLCARHARVCKRSEVEDDDEDDEEGEL